MPAACGSGGAEGARGGADAPGVEGFPKESMYLSREYLGLKVLPIQSLWGQVYNNKVHVHVPK